MIQDTPTTGALDGKFFNGFAGYDIESQGRVERQVDATHWLVWNFSALDGGAYEARLVTLAEMEQWRFYETAEQMNYRAALHEKQRRRT